MAIRMNRSLAVPVLGLLFTTAIVTAPAALAEPTDTCDPDPADRESANYCAGKPPQTWPAAQGNFTVASDPGWVFFRPFFSPRYGCGIGPDGTVGCDHVPGDPFGNVSGSFSCGDLRCPLPPPGANQTVAGPQEPGRYVHSETLTFTRDVDYLREGYRLVNGDAWCAVGYQGSVSCTSGANGFTLASWGGILE